MVEIECLACGKVVKLPKFIDTDDYDYDGQVVCQECKSLLHVKLEKGKPRKYKLVEKIIPPSVPITHVEIIKDYGQGRQVREEDKSEESGTGLELKLERGAAPNNKSPSCPPL